MRVQCARSARIPPKLVPEKTVPQKTKKVHFSVGHKITSYISQVPRAMCKSNDKLVKTSSGASTLVSTLVDLFLHFQPFPGNKLYQQRSYEN